MLIDNPKTFTPTDERLVSLVKPHSFEADQFRRLRQRIELFAVERQLKALVITSAVANDGKTFTAINLAGALASARNRKVLLIDADLRHPSVAKSLGLEVTEGIIAAMQPGARPFQHYVEHVVGAQMLDVLPCETTQADTYELLTSPAFLGLVAQARANYDFVIIDTPPIIPVPDTGLLGRVVEGYLLVVSANLTPRKLVGEALNLLEPASVLGIVFNRDSRPLFGYYHSSYRRYFQSYTRSLSDTVA